MRQEFERIEPYKVGIRAENIKVLLKKIKEIETELHGIIIMRHGKICFEHWWEPYGKNMVHGQQSLTKTYTGTAVGIAYTQGLLSLDEHLVDIFKEKIPADPSDYIKKLTIRNVLTMTNGMVKMPMPPSTDWVSDWLREPIVYQPGSVFMYNMLGSSILGEIICRKTNMGLHDFLKKYLFNEIGIDASRVKWITMADGIEMGSGGIFTTTEDNLRLIKLYLDNGICGGKRILAQDFVEEATRKWADTSREIEHNPYAQSNLEGYGYQMWMCPIPHAYRADGGLGQFAIAFPDQDMIIALNETATAKGTSEVLQAVWEFIHEVEKNDRDGIWDKEMEQNDSFQEELDLLTIPLPRIGRNKEAEQRIQGKAIRLVKGRCSFSVGYGEMVSGKHPSAGIEMICFYFNENDCVIEIQENGRKFKIKAGMDGQREVNEYNIDDFPSKRVDMSAYWEKNQTLVVTARWTETCYEKSLVFHFGDREIIIQEKLLKGDIKTTSLWPDNSDKIGQWCI